MYSLVNLLKKIKLICSLRYPEYSFYSPSSTHHIIPFKDGCQPPSHWSREDRCSWRPCNPSMERMVQWLEADSDLGLERGCASKLQVGGRSNDDWEMSSTPWLKKWIEQDIETQCLQRHIGARIEPTLIGPDILTVTGAENEFVDLQSEIFGELRSKRHFSLSLSWAVFEWNTFFIQNVDLRSELFCAFCNLNPDLKPYFLASCANNLSVMISFWDCVHVLKAKTNPRNKKTETIGTCWRCIWDLFRVWDDLEWCPWWINE